jgi:hypothetical protein
MRWRYKEVPVSDFIRFVLISVRTYIHYTHTHTHTHIHIYIYREREREKVVILSDNFRLLLSIFSFMTLKQPTQTTTP